jgi:RHS repeat-associated protein
MITRKLVVAIGALGWSLSVFAQLDPVVDQTQGGIKADGEVKVDTSEPVVVDKGAHYRTWRRVVLEQQPDGTTTERESVYTELGTGLNAFRDGSWVPAEEVLTIGADAVLGDRGQHFVRLPLNINTLGGIEFSKDDKRFRSHVLGLAFTDAATGQSVLIAELQDSKAEQFTKNSIIYRSAFRGPFQADLRYTYTLAGLEQDVIIRESLPAPSDYGLPPESTRLEIFSEFIESPQPAKQFAVISAEGDAAKRQQMVDPDLTDEQLAWSEIVMGAGAAFPLDGAQPDLGAPVGKSWVSINDPDQGKARQFLIEKIDYGTIKPQLEQLPKAAAQAGQEKIGAALKSRREALMAAATPGSKNRGAQRAALPPRTQPDRGYVIDYSMIVSQTNFTFYSDSTYYVSNGASVYLSGMTTLESAVVKFASTAVKIQLLGPLDCRTSTYRPAYFIAKDDNTVGEPISGSTGNPGTNVYGLSGIELASAGTTFDLHDVRIRNCNKGLTVGNCTAIFSHSQVSMTQYLLRLANSGYPAKLRNVLAYDIRKGMQSNPTTTTSSWEHVTLHRVDTLREWTASPLLLTNCLLISVTNALVYSGINNIWSLSDAGYFQSLGAGARYLATGSSYRSGGSPNIDPTLASALKKLTLDPPILLTTNFAVSTTLLPCVVRDTNAAPGYGYHYPSLDYCLSGLNVSGATLTLSNGVAIGIYGSSGLTLQSGAKLVSCGKPETMNVLAPYYAIQEIRTNWGVALANLLVQAAGSMSTYPSVDLRFTEVPLIRQSASRPYFYASSASGPANLTLRDCLLVGGYINLVPQTPSGTPPSINLGITNNVFEGVQWIFYQGYNGFETPMFLQLRNNLFRGGSLGLSMSERVAEWFVHDNLFDTNALTAPFLVVTNSHNGYRNTAPLPGTWGYNKILTTNDFQTGALGRYYYPATGGNLSSLIDSGSRSATNVGLYHYTTKIDHAKELNSIVDIGFHYVALSNAVPMDTDADGLADYLEDTSGDGLYQIGEKRWRGIPSAHVITFSAQPLNYYAGAGIVVLDAAASVLDNDSSDQNYLAFTNLTIQVSRGDVIRLLPTSRFGVNNGAVTLDGNAFATVSGGDGALPLRFRLLNGGASATQCQDLLRALQFSSEAPALGDSGFRSVNATLTDSLGVGTSASRSVKINSSRLPLIVDAGPDVAVIETSQGNDITIVGRVRAQAAAPHVFAQWKLVEPQWWEYPTLDPLDYVPDPYLIDMTDLLGQIAGTNPQSWFALTEGAEQQVSLTVHLPTPNQSYLCDFPFLGDPCREARRYRFQLVANDGTKAIMDEVTVKVLPTGNQQPPEVNIRPVLAAKPYESVIFKADVLNEPSESLSYQWEIEAGQGTVSGSNWTFITAQSRYRSTQADPQASFNVAGRYHVTLTVTDSTSRTGSDNIWVKACNAPNSKAEIMFVADASKSMLGQKLIDLLSAGTTLAQMSDPGLHQIGVASFAEQPYLALPLTSDSSLIAPLLAQIKYVHADGAMNSLAAGALELATQQFHDPVAKKIIVLFTDGLVSDAQDVWNISAEFRQHGIRLVTVLTYDPWQDLVDSSFLNAAAFMKGIATSETDAYVARSGKIASIISDVVGGLCSGDGIDPWVDLGPERTIKLGQQLTLLAQVQYPGIASDPAIGTTYSWSLLSSTPAGQQVSFTTDGPTDADAVISVTQPGDYTIQAVVQDPLGHSGRGQVILHVLPANADAYSAVVYQAVIFAYGFGPILENAGECAELPVNGLTPSPYTYSAIRIFHCPPSPLMGAPCRLMPGTPTIPMPGIADMSWCGNPWTGVPCDGTASHRPTLRYVCDNPGGPFVKTRAIVANTVTYAFGPDGAPKILSLRAGWPAKPCFRIPDAAAGTLADTVGSFLVGAPAFSHLESPGSTHCDQAGYCDNWRRLEVQGAQRLVKIRGLENSSALRLIMNPASGSSARSYKATPTMGLGFISMAQLKPDAPWQVQAGSDKNVTRVSGSVEVQLAGTVSHRQQPGIAYTPTWRLVNGPSGGSDFPSGGVNNLTATVHFSVAGTYLFKLEVNGTDACSPPVAHTATSYLTINVDQGTVDAGADQIVDWDYLSGQATATLHGIVNGSGGTPQWVFEEGPGWPTSPIASGNQNMLEPPAVFTANGVYRFRLHTTIGDDRVTIQVNKAPTLGNYEISPPRYGIWSPRLAIRDEITTDGLELIAEAEDDSLPIGQPLQYRWSCVTHPPDGNCRFENARGQSTWTSFSSPGHYEITLVVSDTRLSTENTLAIEVIDTNDPLTIPPAVSFEVTAGSRGNALSLFAPGSDWDNRYVHAAELAHSQLTRFDASGNPHPVDDSTAFGPGSLEFSGSILRYTPRISLANCERATERFTVTLTNRYGNAQTGTISIHVVPRSPSKEEYEASRSFKFMVYAGSQQLVLHLRDMLSLCDEHGFNSRISGPPAVFEHLASRIGVFSRYGNDPDTLYFDPTNGYSGNEPISETLTYYLDGAPGVGTVNILLLPNGSELSADKLSGLTVAPPAEVGEEVLFSTFKPEPTADGFQFDWQITRLDGTLSGNSYVITHPPLQPSGEDLSQAKVTFNDTGTFKVTVTITHGVSVGIYDTLITIVAKGTLIDPNDAHGESGFGESTDPEPDPTLTVPGRAVILNLPNPGLQPFEITDGYLSLRGQAAGPTDESPCSYKVLLYPADAGNVCSNEVDDSNLAVNLTSELTVAGIIPTIVNGWMVRCVAADPSQPNVNTDLGSVDLVKYTNGNYFVQLWAKGPNGVVGKSPKHPILLKTERKPGKIVFSDTDFTLPLADGRIRIVRGYDSEIPPPSAPSAQPELGWGWSLRLMDVAVQLYEQRAQVSDQFDLLGDPDGGLPQTFNVRAGGPHHVTLNLPWNGNRVTFLQGMEGGLPFWATPDTEGGRLDAPEEDRRAFAALQRVRAPNGFVPLSVQQRSVGQFDFSYFILTGPDGTRYFLTRGTPQQTTFSAWANDPALGVIYSQIPSLTHVEYPDGATLDRAFENGQEILKLYPAPASAPVTLTVIRAAGKVTEVHCSEPPAGSSDASRPVVKYLYYQQGDAVDSGTLATGDNRIGNLKQVWRLVRTTANNDSDYDITTYFYTNSASAQLLTRVVGPLGLPTLQAIWNDQSQLIKTVDAAGIERAVAHTHTPSPPSDSVVVTSPYGNLPVGSVNAAQATFIRTEMSDTYGNVYQTTVDAPANSGVSALTLTTHRDYDGTLLKADTDAAQRVTQFIYDGRGRIKEVHKPGEVTEFTGYDDQLGQLSSATDGRTNTTLSTYNDGRLVATEDAEHHLTSYFYYESGPDRGKLYYVEDALGNQTVSEYYSASDPPGDSGGKSGALKTTYTKQKNSDGTFTEVSRTTRTYYPNGLLQSTYSTRTGRDNSQPPIPTQYQVKTEYKYDAQGRVTETIAYPSENPFTPVLEGQNYQLHSTKTTYNRFGKVSTTTDKYGNITSFFYDDRGNLVETIYPSGIDSAGTNTPVTISRTVYDVNNRPIYEQSQHVPQSSDTSPYPLQTTTFGTHKVYDALGRIAKVEKVASVTVSLSSIVNTAGEPLYRSQLVSAGQVLESSTMTYDAISRVLQVTSLSGSYNRYEYSDAESGNRAKRFTFMGAPEIKISEEELDGVDNVVSAKSYSNATSYAWTTFEYDALNRKTKSTVQNEDGTVYSEATEAYDALGRRVRAVDPDAKAIDFAYDALGRLRFVTNWIIQATLSTPLVTEFAYDELGNQISQTDALGRVTRYEYDNAGRRILRKLPAGQSETFAYDIYSLGQLLDSNNKLVQRAYHTSFNGQVIKLIYDVSGRVVWKGLDGSASPSPIGFSYTPWGARRSMTDASGTTFYVYGRPTYDVSGAINGQTYDSDRLLVKYHDQLGGITYDYDLRGSVTRIDTQRLYSAPTFDAPSQTYRVSSTGNDTSRTLNTYAYDSYKRLYQVWQGPTGSGKLLAQYSFLNNGVLSTVTYPLESGTSDDIIQRFDYNAARSLRRVNVQRGSVAPTSLASFDYDHADSGDGLNWPAQRLLTKAGLRRAAREIINGVALYPRQMGYSYDSLSRVTKEEQLSGATWNTTLGYVQYDEPEPSGYDAVGNRRTRTASGFSGVASQSGLTYDFNDRLDMDPSPANNPQFDASGNTTAWDPSPGTAGDEWTYTYDYENHLLTGVQGSSGAQTIISLTQSGDGDRLKKVVDAPGTANDRTVWYLVDDRNPSGYPQVLEERSVANGSPTVSYVYGLDLIRRKAGTIERYFVYDGSGSSRALVDGTPGSASLGQITDTYTYDAFGILTAQTPASGGTPNVYLYTGEQWDADLGMYYLRSRYYHPQLGRFWTMDSFQASQADPLGLHKYLYVHDNPVNMVDPSGQDGELMTLVTVLSISINLSQAYTHAVNKQYGLMVVDLLGAVSGGFGLAGGLGAMESMLPNALRLAGAGEAAASVTMTAAQLKGIAAIIAGTELSFAMAKHHIMTDKNSVSDAPNGQGPFTPKFKELLEGTGIELSDDLNIKDVIGHSGPHPEANQYTYDALVNAVKGLAKNSPEYIKSITETLKKLGLEAATPGTPLNRMLTSR